MPKLSSFSLLPPADFLNTIVIKRGGKLHFKLHTCGRLAALLKDSIGHL